MSTRYFGKAYPFHPPMLCLENGCDAVQEKLIASDNESAKCVFECFGRVKLLVWDLTLTAFVGEK
jgi:hypothetical protein